MCIRDRAEGVRSFLGRSQSRSPLVPPIALHVHARATLGTGGLTFPPHGGRFTGRVLCRRRPSGSYGTPPLQLSSGGADRSPGRAGGSSVGQSSLPANNGS